MKLFLYRLAHWELTNREAENSLGDFTETHCRAIKAIQKSWNMIFLVEEWYLNKKNIILIILILHKYIKFEKFLYQR